MQSGYHFMIIFSSNTQQKIEYNFFVQMQHIGHWLVFAFLCQKVQFFNLSKSFEKSEK